jgi:hypothetical protein
VAGFDLELIRAAIGANLATLVAAEGMQFTPYMLAEPTPPTVQVLGSGDIVYDVAMQRGGDQNEVLVQAFVSMISDIGGQMKLDRLLASSGPSSMKEAIQSDPTLGGIVDDLRVTRSNGHTVYRTSKNEQVIGSTWYVQVETTR